MRSIVKNGFDVSKGEQEEGVGMYVRGRTLTSCCAVGCTTDPGVYGAGMYLSESADSSLAYGGGAHLLLCKV